MAKTNSPLWSLRAWGKVGESAVYAWNTSLGSGIFRREGSYTQLERYYQPSNPRTEAQQDNRSMFLDAVAAWQGLSASDWASWNHYQDVRRRRPIMSGYNLFISKYLLSGGNPTIPASGRREDWEQESGWSMPEEGEEEMVIKSGIVASPGSGSVTFNTAFASIPQVVLTVQDDTSLRDCLYKVTAVSETGFSYETDVVLTLAWIATDAGNA